MHHIFYHLLFSIVFFFHITKGRKHAFERGMLQLKMMQSVNKIIYSTYR